MAGAGSEQPTVAATAAPPARAACPSCAFLLETPPSRNRLCPRCRQPIVVRRMEGRLVLLTETAVAVFEAERKREADVRTWTAERRRWLGLAANVKAPPARRKKLAAAPLSAAVVQASRALYLSTAERAVREARHAKRWGDVGRIRREQAAALYQEAGSPVPPPDDIVEMYRDGMSAVLRSLAALARNAEIVGAACCKTCREADGTVVRIATELREPRLPHAGCPRGLCGCDWWIAVVERKPSRRRRPAPQASEAPQAGVAAGGSEAMAATTGEAGEPMDDAAGEPVPGAVGDPEAAGEPMDDAAGDPEAAGISASRSG